MIPDFLVKGAIRLGIGYILTYGSAKVIDSKIGNIAPEGAYAYRKKKRSPLWTIGTNVAYFVPVLGTIELVLDGLIAAGCVTVAVWAKKDPNFIKDTAKKTYDKVVMPDERVKELERGKEMYKGITDSLKLEGLSQEEINKELKEARKEYPYIKENNDKEIEKNQIRVQNLQLLDEVKDYLKDPKKAYRFTVNKRIESAEIDGDTLTIGVSKSDKENAKIKTKKFKLID